MHDATEPTRDSLRDALPEQAEDASAEPPLRAGQSTAIARAVTAAAPDDTAGAVRTCLDEQRLDVATQLMLRLLERRVAAGDTALEGVRLLLQHYATIVSQMAPLAHLGCAPLRPDDRLHQCFAAFVELLHRQGSQLVELQAIVAELV